MASIVGWAVIAAVLLIIYLIYSDLSTPSTLKEPETLVIRDYTPADLKQFNGVNHEKVLMAVNGRIYDVTVGKAHYGPGGTYANFAGRDASRGLAKHSFDDEMLTPINAPVDPLTDLNSEERASLQQWAEFFEGKYPYCGRLINP